MRRAVWNEQTCHIFQNLRQISIFFTFTKYLVTVLIFKSVTAVRVLLQSIPMKLIAVLYQRILKSENCSRRVLPFPSCQVYLTHRMQMFPPVKYFCNVGGQLCHSMHKLHILFDFLYKIFNLRNVIYAKKSKPYNFAI